MPSKKLLILGAGYHQLPAIQKARQLGYYVITISNNQSDEGVNLADKFYHLSTLDKEGVLNVARLEKIDGVMTMASEIAASTVAFVAESLLLPGFSFSTATCISNKFLLKNKLKEYGLTSSVFGEAYTLDQALQVYRSINKPAIMKPLLASGSKGLKKINSEQDIRENFEASRQGSFIYDGVIIEEYLEGIHLGGAILFQDHQIIFNCISEKRFNKYFVTEAHILPSILDAGNRKKILDLLQNVVKALELKSGVLDFDIVLTKSGPEIIELGGRLGGNGISELIEFHTGIDLISAVIKIAMNEKVSLQVSESNSAACFVVGSNKEGKLKSIKLFDQQFPQEGKSLIIQKSFQKEGSQVNLLKQGNCQVGNIFVRKDTREELIVLLNKMEKLDWVETY